MGWYRCVPAPAFGRRSFLELGPDFGRRSFLKLTLGVTLAGVAGGIRPAWSAEPRRYRIAFANITEDPAERIEGLGFTGAEVRASFVFGARQLPVDMVFYDNDRSRDRTLANVEDAVRQRVDLYIQYGTDETANAEVGKRLKTAGIPVLAINYPVPGAPLYTADNALAGRIAGEALAKFALGTWRDQRMAAVILGDLANKADRVPERADGVAAALKEKLPSVASTRLDSGGNPGKADGLLRRFVAAQTGTKFLVAAMDDATALAAKGAVEAAGRTVETVIASQGCDRSVHGGASEKKEIDPTNRASILIGSVAYLLDRYGYDVLPMALHLLGGEALPPRTTTQHVLVTPANVFHIYPPIDMN